MTSAQLKTLLAPPDLNLSETRALEYLDSNFASWSSLGSLSHIDKEVQRTRAENDELQTQLKTSQENIDGFIADTVRQTQQYLDSAQKASLKRHILADEISALQEELAPDDDLRGKSSLLYELEQLHKRLAELEGAKVYMQVLEQGLRLSEKATQAIREPPTVSFSGAALDPFRNLRSFVLRATELLVTSQSTTPTTLNILQFLQDLMAQTWKDIKGILSSRLIAASEKIAWPLPINLTTVSPVDTESFRTAFSDMLALQSEGEAFRSLDEATGEKTERDGLYALEALVHPVALRFKFHFDGTRPTNRLDKPEWYFTHILNIAHEHRGFMEYFIQPLLEKSSFRNINAQNEFTRLLFPILARKIRRSVPTLLTQPGLFAHTIYQALLFDSAIREAGFTLANTWECARDSHKGKEWPGVVDVILGHKAWFDEWMEAERQFTERQYNEIILSPDAFAFTNDDGEENQPFSEMKTTNSARRIKALLDQVTGTYL
ncbi:RINT-1 family protein [Ceratobasidium sp. AG-Ba]|nr:RINT-1 family protein [Ceratobasidium sp. AG-Ba]